MKWISSLAVPLLLAACTDGGGAGPSIAGTYHGDLIIEHDDPARSVFTSATIVLDDAGDLAGSMLTTKIPSDIVGEIAPLTGSIVMSSEAFADAELAMAFPTFGSFTTSGTMGYSVATRELSGNMVARDESGAVIGKALVSVRQ